jgi:hypothetical protein
VLIVRLKGGSFWFTILHAQELDDDRTDYLREIISEEEEGDKPHLTHLPERLEGLLGRLQKSRPNDYSYTANDKRSTQTRYGKCQYGSEPEKPQSDCSRAHRSLGTFRLLAFLNPLRFLLNNRRGSFPDFFLESGLLISTQSRPPHDPLDLFFPLLPF